MAARTPRRANWPLLDVSAWALMAVATLATVGLAIIAVSTIVPEELPVIAGSAALLVVTAGFAAQRHLAAVHRAEDAARDMMKAQGEELAARDRLSFARNVAATMASLPQTDGLRAVLAKALTLFGAHAAAVVGSETVLVTNNGADESKAKAAVEALALRTTKEGRSVTVADHDATIAAITAPLRIHGELKHVLVVWRRGHAFRSDDLDGLSLVARIIELSMENHTLVDEVRDQLSGTLHMMTDLVEQRLPDYGAHSERVSRYSVALGRAMGLGVPELDELRIAGLLHDVGMLAVPESILNSPRRLTPEELVLLRGHPQHGADLTREAGFPAGVQSAIRSHHERVEGGGYPDGLKGDAIPMTGRILNVCDAFVALISDRPHRPRVSASEALDILRASAGTHYDAELVEVFVTVQPTVAGS